MINKKLYADKTAVTVTYGNHSYRIQNDRGYRHIVLKQNGQRKKITVNPFPVTNYNVLWHYFLAGLFYTHPCRVIDWWLDMKFAGRYFSI